MHKPLRIFTDGGARGNPGPSASAIVVYSGENLVFQNYKYLGVATNNEAEYNAVLLAYEWLLGTKEKYKSRELNFFLDSQLVVNQLNGIYKIKKPQLIALAGQIKKSEKSLSFEKISYSFVRREKNILADKLVNVCIDEKIVLSR